MPTLKEAATWTHWYQTMLGYCQLLDIASILTGEYEEPDEDEEYEQWKAANDWIEGHIRLSLEGDEYAHIASIKGAHNMIKALESACKSKSKRHPSKEALWLTITRANLADYKSVPEYVEAIRKAKTQLADLGHRYTWEITTSLLHGLPSSYESFVKVILNIRGKDANSKILEPDFDEITGRLLLSTAVAPLRSSRLA